MELVKKILEMLSTELILAEKLDQMDTRKGTLIALTEALKQAIIAER
jgi:hypothetical protein